MPLNFPRAHARGSESKERLAQTPPLVRLPENLTEGPIGRGVLGQDALDTSIELQHARLLPQGGLLDCSSLYGTHVNGKRIESNARHQLHVGDVVQFGHGRANYTYTGAALSVMLHLVGRIEERYSGAARASDVRFGVVDADELRSGKVAGCDPSFSCSSHGVLMDINSKGTLRVDGKNITESAQLVDGNIVRVSAPEPMSFYYDQGRLVSIDETRADLLEHLFPDGVPNTKSKQGEYGNCSVVATIHLILKFRPANIINFFEPLSNGKVRVHWPGNRPPVDIGLDEARKSGKSGIRGPLGLKVVELAYARTLANRHAYQKTSINQFLDEILSSDRRTYLAFKNGVLPRQALSHFSAGKPVYEHSSSNAFVADPRKRAEVTYVLKQIQRDPYNRIALVATTESQPFKSQFSPCHAYMVHKVDLPNMDLRDSHRSKRIIKIHVDDFMKRFCIIAFT